MFEGIYKIMKENILEIDIEISDDLKCNICNQLMIKACSTICGCRFCSDCIENYLNEIDKLCPGISRYCQKKLINYANDIVIDNHANIRILEVIVKCPRQNCEFKDELQMIEKHMGTCNKNLISCPFNTIGCEMNEVMNDEMKGHLNDDNYCHSKLLISLINNLRDEMESMRNEIIELKRELNLRSQKLWKMEKKEMDNTKEIKILNEEMEALKNKNRLLKSEMETNFESIDEMRQQIKMIQTKSQQEMDELKQNYQQQNKEIEILTREIDKINAQNANGASRLDMQGEAFKQIIFGYINDLPMKMMEMEGKLVNEEFFGEFEWRVESLSERKRETRIYSKPFYSAESGYKMHLSANIGYSGIEIYFHLMRGEFDEELEWPFKCEVKIDVVDPKYGYIHHSETIKYSVCPGDARWRKPSNYRNSAICVFDYKDITSDSPVFRNDQLLIKCRVEPNQ